MACALPRGPGSPRIFNGSMFTRTLAEDRRLAGLPADPGTCFAAAIVEDAPLPGRAYQPKALRKHPRLLQPPQPVLQPHGLFSSQAARRRGLARADSGPRPRPRRGSATTVPPVADRLLDTTLPPRPERRGRWCRQPQTPDRAGPARRGSSPRHPPTQRPSVGGDCCPPRALPPAASVAAARFSCARHPPPVSGLRVHPSGREVVSPPPASPVVAAPESYWPAPDAFNSRSRSALP